MAKLTGEDQKKFLREKLEEQRHFLCKSLDALTSGDLAEGVRAAASIRVLVHETASSKPLLKQLTANYLQLNILDSPEARPQSAPPGTVGAVVMSVPISIRIVSNEGVFLNRKLEEQNRVPTILGKWWLRPSLILPGIGGLSRKEIVLGLVNKEGGAHVDADMSRRYQQLLNYKAFQVGWSQEVTPLNLSRFMAGQAGIELLDCLDRNFPKLPQRPYSPNPHLPPQKRINVG
jgi:hypothetical protein